MKILKRLRPHRSFGAAAAAGLGVLSIVGATLGFATQAGAVLTATPISYGPFPNLIGLVPGQSPTTIGPGATAAPVSSWAFVLSDSGTVTSGVTSGTWALGDSINIPVFENGHQNNYTAGEYVEFAGTPVVACVGGGAGATAPTFKVTTGTNPTDTTADKTAALTDLLTITFTDNPTSQGTTPFNCAILNVAFTTGPVANPAWAPATTIPITTIETDGLVTLPTPPTATYEQGTAPAGTSPVNPTSVYEEALSVQSNAQIGIANVSANNPAVSVLPNALNASISNIVGSETAPGEIPTGYICVTTNGSPANGAGFVITPTSPTLTISPSNTGGTATINPVVSGVGPANPNGSYTTIEADVLAPSLTVPTTFTLSNITVDAPAGVGPVTVTIWVGEDAGCTLVAPPAYQLTSSLQIYAVGTPTFNTRIEGSTADQTAVAALENEYPPRIGFCIPGGIFATPARPETGSTVVLATDNSWQDALTASYLASWLHTGVLLTPPDSLSPYAATAIQQEGVNNVVIVGGTLAISQAVQNQLASTPAYHCGGAGTQTNALGQPINLQVQRIAGIDADTTAQDVATYVDSGYVASLNISGSFGQYNDTLGTDSGSSPTIPVRTAILVTDNSYQDAASASAMSYADHLPILLTPQSALGTQAETALLDLGIQQVIELGGPLAISNAVNSSLASQNISVLRIAGIDGTDTSVQLANFELQHYGTSDGLGWSNCGGTLTDGFGVTYNTGCTTPIALARGDFFSDAITSSVVTGRNFEPIILTENPTTLGTYATGFFNTAGNGKGIDPQYDVKPLSPIAGSGTTISSITVFGGPLAIAPSTLQAALNAISAG